MHRSAEVLTGYGNVVWSVAAEGLEPELAPVDLVVVAVTMASPPAALRAFLAERKDCVVLVWAHHAFPRLPEPFTHQSITVRGATVGASMVAASLSQAGIRHDVVLGDAASPQVHDALRCAAAAASIRGCRILVVGEPLDGYDFVMPPEGEISRLGMTLVTRTPEDIASDAEHVSERELAALRAELGVSLREATTAEGEESALRYAHALRCAVDSSEARAGTLNCHVPSLRTGARGGGVAPCFALGRETSRGCPFTCTGDLNTSLAMLLVTALGHPTMYHEMEAIDETTNDVVLANSGEHDNRFAPLSAARVVANPWFPGANPTPIVRFQVAPGPASVVAVAVLGGRLTVVVARGEFTDRPTEDVGTMSASFRFAGSPAASGWRDWVRAGAGHHACATNADVTRDLAEVCRHLDLDLITIGEG
ncbi:MAG: hypothetical protein RJQ01_01430 [Microcella sp.]|uniref:hypothetical protein n=1 Tax=Microcella sp. TaxID=1913979 RepID=UPI0033155CD9